MTARPGHSLEEIETAVNEELARLRSDGPDASEMERAHNTIESRMIERLETFGGFGGKADRLNSYEHYLGNPGYLQQDILRYRQVTAASVKDFAAKYLQSEHRVVVQAVSGEKKLAPEPPSSQSTRGAAKPSAAAESFGARHQCRRAVAHRAAEKQCGAAGANPGARDVQAGERIDGDPVPAARPSRGHSEPDRAVGERRQPAGAAGSRQLHGGDAHRGYRHSQVARDC